MCITEYKEAETMQVFWNEGRMGEKKAAALRMLKRGKLFM